MKKILLILLLLPILSFSNWLDNIKSYVYNDSQYLNILNNFNQSKENYFLKDTFLPSIMISNANVNYSKSDSSESSSLIIPLRINAKIFDFNVSLNGNFSNQLWDDWRDTYSLTISKEIFSETDEELLNAKINLLKSQWNLLNTKNQLFLEYLNKGFNNYYYNELYNIQEKLFEYQKQDYKNDKSKYESGLISNIEFLNSKKFYLNSQIALLNAKKNYEEYKDYNIDYKITELTIPSSSEIYNRSDVIAEQLEIELNKIQNNRIYRLYLPDITTGITFDYNYPIRSDEKKLTTSLFLNFNYNLYDKGYREFQAKQKEDNYYLSKRSYEEKIKNLIDQYDNMLKTLNTLTLTLQTKELDMEIKKLNYDIYKEKYQKKLISEKDLDEKYLEYKQSKLDLEKAKFDIFVQKLNIYSFLGYDLISLFEEEFK
ncbi:TolC family protein [Marinitoga aeolica]|uniref:TolC family protein n=1 Tax=Marinitoga aeolica TaxID=2809031 RepID=A0ABY8PRG9_9BACT|nr:TolC family protein [Marinitoga aeolica]WGS65221.1 TolC family protein [Marinitoga aeolica]